ncbi:MAG: hypothetical protein H0V29_03120 [Thermoleophilaceae bacterium]|nr:hypothetical protein [Thermoleophilaceae bacterium]
MRRLALILVSLLALPAGAQAASASVGKGLGPAFQGENVVYTQRSGLRTDLKSLSPAGRSAKLGTLFTDDDPAEDEGGGSNSFSASALAASDKRIAYGYSSLFNKVRGFTHNIASLTPGGAGATVASQTGDEFSGPWCGPDIDFGGFDVSANAVAYATDNGSCTQQPVTNSILVADFDAGGKAAALATGAVSGPVRIAGRFVAFKQSGDVAVFDRAAGTVAYIAGQLDSYDLQDDGKLVGSSAGGALVWFSAQEPVAHALGATGSNPRLAGDRVTYVTGGRASPELRVQPLAGGTPVSLAKFPANTPIQFDFDGRRAAWRTPGCGLETLQVEEAGGAVAAQPSAVCAARFGRASLRARRGLVRIPVSCSTACAATLSLTGGVRARSVDGLLEPGARQTFRLTKTSLRRAARKRRVRIRVRASVEQVGLGDAKTYSKTYTLRLR